MAGSERGTVAKVIGNRTAPMWIVLTMTRSGSALGLTCINLWKFAIFPTHNPTVYKGGLRISMETTSPICLRRRGG